MYPFLIINKHNQNMLIIGSKCIHHFGEKAIKRMKELKDEKKGKIKCPKCKKTVPKQIVKKYQHETKIYHIKCYGGQNNKEINIFDTDYHNELPPPYEPPILNFDFIVNIGKFKGKLITELFQDTSYCQWILSVEKATGQMKEIQEYLNNYSLIKK